MENKYKCESWIYWQDKLIGWNGNWLDEMKIDWMRWILIGWNGYWLDEMDIGWMKWILIGSTGYWFDKMDIDWMSWMFFWWNGYGLDEMDIDWMKWILIGWNGYWFDKMDIDWMKWILIWWNLSSNTSIYMIYLQPSPWSVNSYLDDLCTAILEWNSEKGWVEGILSFFSWLIFRSCQNSSLTR